MAATDNDNTEQNIPMDPANLEEEGNISKSLLSVISAMQENLTSSNSIHLIPKCCHFTVLLFACKLALVASFKGKYSFEFRD